MDGYRRVAGLPGFTLVELLIAVTLLGMLLGIGVPGFERARESVRMRAGLQRLWADILYTRSEAIKRNVQVVMCPSPAQPPEGRSCGGVFAQGWLIYADRDGDRELDAGEPLLRAAPGLDAGLTLTNRAATRDAGEIIVYLPDGSSRRNRTLMLCSARRPDLASFSVVINRVGRPRMARDWGECPGDR